MNRRHFLRNALIGSAAISMSSPTFAQKKAAQPSNTIFQHGVASGDATKDALIIWTRVTTDTPKPKVLWEISTDPTFKSITQSGILTTSQERDFTLKVDVTQLTPNTRYYYRFKFDDVYSPTGKSRTLPLNLNSPLVVAAVSCNNYEDGYFSSFSHIANNPEVDYVFHLGDYIYEYKTGEYGNAEFIKAENRVNDPKHEIIDLSDYRKRYAQYHLDPDLQKLHQEKPFYLIWDDHEIANDTFMDGAKNHDLATEGYWLARKNAATQAYFEWLPVRANSVAEMIRSVEIGNDCHLYLLEQRLDGRTVQLAADHPQFYNPERKLISDKQMSWLKNGLLNEDVNRHVIVNQVMISGFLDSTKPSSKNIDWWTGYPAQRQELLNTIKTMKKPPVIIAADNHRAFTFKVVDNTLPLAEQKTLCYEFLATSITSKNDDRLSPTGQKEKQQLIYDLNPQVLYNNPYDHGYLLITLGKEDMIINYRYNDNILSPFSKEWQGPIFKLNKENKLSQI